MKKQPKRPTTHIILHEDGYHINFNRDDKFSAYIDAPYFSAICLGYFETQTAAQNAINEYRYKELARAA